jgi:hypothetical protein
MNLTNEEYLSIKKYLKKTNPKCSNELLEDLFHDLLIKNKETDITYKNTYFYNGLKMKLLNVETNRVNGIRLAKIYYQYTKNFVIDLSFDIYSDKNLLNVILNKIESLPGKTKARIKDYLILDMSIAEIAKERNLNYDTTKATIKRGLDILKKELKNVK